jgi:spore coat polysaccharide biosynthesis protein SpsF
MGAHKKTIAIIQARMSSTRLPAKVLLPLAGQTCIEQIYRRLKYCRTLDQIILATSDQDDDVLIANLCQKIKLECFRGSLNDVLDRYYQAATHYQASTIVRITADCPLIDPVVVDTIVTAALAGDFDQFSLSGSFPDGLDVEVFKYAALQQAWKDANLKSEREHVGPYFGNHPELFKRGSLEIFQNLGHHRWTLDEPNDYELLKQIYESLDEPNKLFLTNDILDLFEERPELLEINSGIMRNEGYALSLQKDERLS